MSYRVQVPAGCQVLVTTSDGWEQLAEPTDWVVLSRVSPAGADPYFSLSVIKNEVMQRLAAQYDNRET